MTRPVEICVHFYTCSFDVDFYVGFKGYDRVENNCRKCSVSQYEMGISQVCRTDKTCTGYILSKVVKSCVFVKNSSNSKYSNTKQAFCVSLSLDIIEIISFTHSMHAINDILYDLNDLDLQSS